MPECIRLGQQTLSQHVTNNFSHQNISVEADGRWHTHCMYILLQYFHQQIVSQTLIFLLLEKCGGILNDVRHLEWFDVMSLRYMRGFWCRFLTKIFLKKVLPELSIILCALTCWLSNVARVTWHHRWGHMMWCRSYITSCDLSCDVMWQIFPPKL